MRRLAEAGGTAHELMAISGHKTLTEVQRYTDDADKKLLADERHGEDADRARSADYTNTGAPLHKHGKKVSKATGDA